jgi:protein tyrosine phosphatase (PTP) superfamily phosphohydrolase (DUF442 family)
LQGKCNACHYACDPIGQTALPRSVRAARLERGFQENEIALLKAPLSTVPLSIAATIFLVSVTFASEPAATRPASWAQPITLSGVPNLHKISDTLYRSAQPSAQGMKNLKQMGIETIVNLRSFHSDRAAIGNTGLGYEHIYMKTWHPEHEDVVRFLQIVTNPKRAPVLVHCQHGADRTGAMSAIYRVAAQGWTKEEAIREMTEGEFGFHEIWIHLPGWIADLDIASLRQDAGISNGTGRGVDSGTENRSR